MDKIRIGAIVVLYNPDLTVLNRVLECLHGQVDSICAIDNSDSVCYDGAPTKLIDKYVKLDFNKGIAAAQNVGLRYFIQKQYDYILFVDQDTIIKQGTVKRLLDTYLYLLSKKYDVGTVCPIGRDKDTHVMYTYNIAKIRDLIELQHDNMNIMEVIHTMSSMSLVKVSHFERVGLMDESLFIDGVDCEWCWRAGKLSGFRFFYDKDIIIDHKLGYGNKKVAGRTISLATPFRLFYQYRNYLWFLRRDYVPKQWLRKNGMKYIIKMVYYPLFAHNRWLCMKNIIRGISAGMKKQVIKQYK